jgi:hypothetical protein
MTIALPVTVVKWHQTRDLIFLTFTHSDEEVRWVEPSVVITHGGRALHVKDEITDM